jgi:hypothetical protein
MAERVLVDNTADLNATIEVVEAATGKVVLSFADRPTFEMMLGGVAAPVVGTVAGAGHGGVADGKFRRVGFGQMRAPATGLGLLAGKDGSPAETGLTVWNANAFGRC